MNQRGHTHLITLAVMAFLVIVGAEQVYTWYRQQTLVENTKATLSQVTSQARHALESLGCSTEGYDKGIQALVQGIQDDPKALKASVDTMRLLLKTLAEGQCKVHIEMPGGESR